MWGVLIVIVVSALTGLYGLPAEQRQTMVEGRKASELADSMGLYRQAVVAYFTLNNVTNTSVGIDTLKAAGTLPVWSALYSNSSSAIWQNYRDNAGVIYIYPAAAGTPAILNEVLALSRQSINVGIYRAADHSLYSPVDGNRIALAPLGAAVIPDAAPVWLAARQ